ncbi:MAG: hypothetical protein H6725_07045 [Sandaracinaceae bacterium]|nr:hypothetical protein [Sandaracinaceae bacterium]
MTDTTHTVPSALIARLLAEHRCAAGATEAEIDDAESRLGLELPLPLLEVLRATNGADLWHTGDFPCRLLSTRELARPEQFVYQPGPEALVAVVASRGNAQCLAIQTDRFSAHFGRIVDCHHETYPYEILGVCDSIVEMLRLVLDCEGREWMWPAAQAYDVNYAR